MWQLWSKNDSIAEFKTLDSAQFHFFQALFRGEIDCETAWIYNVATEARHFWEYDTQNWLVWKV